MTVSGKDVVREFVDAFARGDIDSALGHLAADSLVDEADGLQFSGRYHGPDGFKKLLDTMGSRLEASVDGCDYVVGDDGVVITKMALTFSSRATGRKLPTRVTELYTVQNGKIVHLDSFYKDPAGVAALYAEN
ncbi:nuclear transport factor 2 family protein [Pseudonocardia sp. GCM10023141]|uniref:nuclear transport factor 2 family protein n=1 Tax=Pseudonocardia sp. GCM10023141 TaxID=3252653 RepID=UPI003621725C